MHFLIFVIIITLEIYFISHYEIIMNKLKIKKTKEKKWVWWKFRYYIDFLILICCSIVAFNIHPSKITENQNAPSDKKTMIYVFHDYEWNEYIMNDNIHGSYSSWDYLFDDKIPDELEWDEQDFAESVSLWDLLIEQEWQSSSEEFDQDNTELIKDNQVSLDDIASELWIWYINNENASLDTWEALNSDALVISIWNSDSTYNKDSYTVREENLSGAAPSLIIERIDTNNQSGDNYENNNVKYYNSGSLNQWSIGNKTNNTGEENLKNKGTSIAKSFASIEENWIIPVLISRNDLFYENNNKSVSYRDEIDNLNTYSNNQSADTSGVTIINKYADCKTPWWYKIHHWDSVLAYKQIDNAPDICNIERRFCWKWKLSWTYTQQWCSVSKDYTYEQRGNPSSSQQGNNYFGWEYRQNSDWSVTVNNNEIWWTFVFDRPNNVYTDFKKSDNIREESSWVEQTTRPYPDCTAPRWEKVKHWQFVQAFKHANWFSDAPCEAQIRLCSMWELMWTYTESTCKTRDTSFIDRVNGSPTWETYSKEKIERIKKQIKNEEIYYENTRKSVERSTNSDALDKILWILDQD